MKATRQTQPRQSESPGNVQKQGWRRHLSPLSPVGKPLSPAHSGDSFFNIDNDLHAILRFVPAVPGKKYVTPKKTLHGHLTPGDCRCTFVGGWACRRFSLALSRAGNSCRTGGLLRNSPPRGLCDERWGRARGKVNGSLLGDACKGNSSPDVPLLTAPHKGGSAFCSMPRHGASQMQ